MRPKPLLHHARWSWLALAAGPALPLNAADWHVSPSGSDSQAGTALAPWATIGKAAALAQAGDTVWIAPGNYRETVRPANSGAAGARIVFRGWEGRPTINGADGVAGPWTRVGESQVYWATWVGDYTSAINNSDQIFADGVMLNLLRWPKETNHNLTRPREAAIDSLQMAPPQTTVTETQWDQPDGRWTDAKVWVNLSNLADGQGQSGRIIGTSLASRQITWTGIDTRSGGSHEARPWFVRVGTAYYLFDPTPEGLAATGGAEAALGEGEWWLDRTARRLYLRLPDGADPSSRRIEAKRRDWGFNLVDRSHITVRDLNLFATSINTDPDPKWQSMGATVAASTGLLLDNLEVDYVSHFIDQAGDYQVQWAGTSGIVLSGRGHTLRNCVFRWSAAAGVSVVGEGHRVYNNLFENAGYLVTEAGSINMGKWNTISRDHKVGYNTIRESASLGMAVWQLRNSDPQRVGLARLHHNHVHDIMQRVWDGAAIAWVGCDGQWVRVDHNLIHGIPDFLHFGIYPDYGPGGAGAMRYQIDHNVVYDAWSPIGGNGFHTIRINNNVAINTTRSHPYMPSGISTQNGSRDNLGVEIYNNILTGSLDTLSQAARAANLTGSQSTVAAYFTDGSNADLRAREYTLKSTATTAIDQGVTVSPWDDPVAGTAPDIGAYERGRDSWRAGYGAVPWYLDDHDTLRVGAQGATLRGSVVLHPFASHDSLTGLTVPAASVGVRVELGSYSVEPDASLPVAVVVSGAAPVGTGWFEVEGALPGGNTHRQVFTFEVLPMQGVTRLELSEADAEPWILEPESTYRPVVTAYDQNDQPLVAQPDYLWSVSGGGSIDGSGLLTTGHRQGGPFLLTASLGELSVSQSFQVLYDWARRGTVSASSENNASTTVAKVVDDDPSSLWVSQPSDPQWVLLDLGEEVSLDTVALVWHGSNYPTQYALEVSEDGGTWTRLRLVTGNTGGGSRRHFDLHGPPARWMRVLLLARPASNSRYGMHDFNAYGLRSADTAVESFALTITADHGAVDRAPDKTAYTSGETVLLTARPEAGYRFVEWTGDASGSNARTSVVMEADRSVTAVFARLPTLPPDGRHPGLPAAVGTATALVADGIPDLVWGEAPLMEITLPVRQTAADRIAGPLDLSANWSALWDAANLYFLVVVTDDVVQAYGGAWEDNPVWWADDSVEIYLDPDSSGGSTYDRVNDCQIGFRPLDPANWIYYGANSIHPLTGIKSGAVLTGSGYILEVALPWDAISVDPDQLTRIGIEVAVNDGDPNQGAWPPARLGWRSDGNNAANNPSVFGTLPLRDPPFLASCFHNLGGGFRWAPEIGFVYDGFFPFLYLYSAANWLYLYAEGAGEADGYFLYDFGRSQLGYSGCWFYPYYVRIPLADPAVLVPWNAALP